MRDNGLGRDTSLTQPPRRRSVSSAGPPNSLSDSMPPISATLMNPLWRGLGKTGLWIDEVLRRRNGVREYSTDPRCVFRMQLDFAERDFVLTDGTVLHRGDTIV